MHNLWLSCSRTGSPISTLARSLADLAPSQHSSHTISQCLAVKGQREKKLEKKTGLRLKSAIQLCDIATMKCMKKK